MANLDDGLPCDRQATTTQRLGLPDEQRACRSHVPRNISDVESWGSILGGAAMVWGGLRQGGGSGLLLVLGGGGLIYRGLTGHCHLYHALGIDTAEHPPATAVPAQQGVKIEKTIVVNRAADEMYAFWKNVEYLPSVMRHLVRVEAIEGNRTHWIARGPMGRLVEWDAETINQREPELIAWRSLPGSQVQTAGSVHFKPLEHGRGTAVTISIKYNPPAGKVGATIASLLGCGLEQELEEDLHYFKTVMEAGAAHTSEEQGN